MNIKKILLIFFIMLGIVISVYPENRGVLPEVMKPSMIDVSEDRLYVMDAEQIHVYSLKELKHINSFGRKGEGPGEYQIIPQMPLRLYADKQIVMIESINKVLMFDHDGNYKKEIRKRPFINIIQPAGQNFIGRRIIQPRDGSESSSSVWIYDREMKDVKKLYQQKFIQQGNFPKLRLNMGKDFLLFSVYRDMVFIERSMDGPFIDVYDANGKKLYEVKIPYDKRRITRAYKDFVEKELGQDPHIVGQLRANQMSWKEFSKNFIYEYPEFYPSVQTLEVTNGKIYVKTFDIKEGKEKYLIMDLKGKLLKTLYLKPTVKKWIMSTMMGINLEIIRNDKVYYLAVNEDEEWELHEQAIQ